MAARKTNTQRVNERLQLAEREAAAGNMEAAVAYARAAQAFSRSEASNENVARVIAAYEDARFTARPDGGGNQATPPPVTPPPAAPVAERTVVGTNTRREGMFLVTYQLWSDGSQTEIDRTRERSAGDDVEAMFTNAGLDRAFVSQLVGIIDNLYQGNVAPTSGQVLNAVYNSEPYKQRFKANEIIRKRIADGSGRPGDRLLTPKEYIDLENTYREVFQSAGMPQGYYDEADDFVNLISNSISASELQSRVNTASDALNRADQSILNSLNRFYNITREDLVAYLLDPAKAMPILEGRATAGPFGLNNRNELERIYRSAEVAGAAERQGLTVDRGTSEEIFDLGKADLADEAFQAAGAADRDLRRLGALYDQPLDFQDMVRETLNLSGGVESGRKRRKLASQERAAFSGQGALDRTSLRKSQDI